MKIYTEMPLVDYLCNNFRNSPIANRIERLTLEELNEIEVKIRKLYPHGISGSDLYDLLDEEFDITCSWICNEADVIDSREPIRYQVRDEEIDTYYGSEDVDENGFTIFEINDIWGEGNCNFWDGETCEYKTLRNVLNEDFKEV